MVLPLNLTAKEAFLLMMPTRRPVINMRAQDLTPSTILRQEIGASPVFATPGHHYNTSSQLKASNLTTDNWFDRDEPLRRIEIAVLATILYLAVFGNGIVLLVLRLRRQKLTRMQWFIAHLALTDIFVAFFNILPQLIWDITEKFYGNDFLCRAMKFFQVVAMYASSFVLVMAAIDRYLSICHPLTSQTLSPKRVHLMITLAWTLSLIFALPQIYIFSLKHVENGDYDCLSYFEPGWGLQAYITWVFVIDYAIPFLILAFCYGRICHVVWASVGAKESAVYVTVRNGVHTQEMASKAFRLRISFRRMRNQPNSSSITSRDGQENGSFITTSVSSSKKPRSHQRGVSRSKVKTVKLTLTVVLCYLFCWAPFFFVQMWTAFEDDASIENPVVVIIMLLASLNSCTNPWIYLAFSGRSCPHGYSTRRASRSWGPSTHVTSAGDSNETKSRTSLMELSHVRMNSRSSSPRYMDKKGQSKC